MWHRRQFRESVGPTAMIGFTGDMLLDYPPGQPTQIDGGIIKALGECDLVVANQEGPLTTAPAQKGLPVNLSAPPESVERLIKMNIGAANLANNHVLDHGADGLVDSLRILRERGIKTFGAGLTVEDALRPCLLDTKCGRLAMVAYGYWPALASDCAPGPARLELQRASEQIRSLRDTGHIVCAQVHGGYEFFHLPRPERRDVLRALIRAGAHFVIAHHAHVFQGIELYEGGLIAYGLGNFYLNLPYMQENLGTDVGLFLAVELDHAGPFAVNYVFVSMSRERAVLSLLTGERARYASRLFDALCAVLPDDREYVRSWRYECLMAVAGMKSSRTPRFRGTLGLALRGILSVLLNSRNAVAPRQPRERVIVLSALRGLPLLLRRPEYVRWHAEKDDLFPRCMTRRH